MSSSKQRLASSTATRLAAITDMAANLEAQLSELNRLCDQLRKAQLSARGFTNDRRTLDERLEQGEVPTRRRQGAPEESWAAVPTKNRRKKLDPGDDLARANGQPSADHGGDIGIRRPMPGEIARHHREEDQGLQQEPH